MARAFWPVFFGMAVLGDCILNATETGSALAESWPGAGPAMHLLVLGLLAERLHRIASVNRALRERMAALGRAEMGPASVPRESLPVCAGCKSVRETDGRWKSLEDHLRAGSGAEVSHGICPDCLIRLYPEYAESLLRKDVAVSGPVSARR